MFDIFRRIVLRPGYAALCVLASLEIIAPWIGWVAFALICGLLIGTFIVTASIRSIAESAFWCVVFVVLGVLAGIFLPSLITAVTFTSGSLLAGGVLGALLWIFCLIPKKELEQ